MPSITDVREYSSSFFFYVCMDELLYSGNLLKQSEMAGEQWSIYKFTFGLRWQIVSTAWYFINVFNKTQNRHVFLHCLTLKQAPHLCP